MSRSICVFCSSSNAVDAAFFTAAEELGTLMARRQHPLIFGGTDVGLMGALARTANAHGGHVVGIIPSAFKARSKTFDLANEVIITHDLRERKAQMEARAEAFIALPGGFGTLEEVLEILTLKQLQFHRKPVVLLNIDGFYDHLVRFFARLHAEHFTLPDHQQLYYVADSAAAALDYIDRYEPVTLSGEWF